MIGRIIKHYMFILSKSIRIKLSLVIMLGIVSSLFVSITKELSNMPISVQKLTFQSTIFSLVFALFFFISSTTLQETIINDKANKRLQLLLANGLPIRDIWIGASLANFVSICIITFLLEATLIIISKIMRFSFSSIFSLTFSIILLVNFPLLMLAFSFLFVKIVLVIRKVEIITTTLFLSYFLVTFGSSSLFKYLIKRVGPKGDIFTLSFVVIFTFIEIVLLTAAFIFRKEVDVEDVTLSIA